jgi:UDP-N-acetylmuramate: L-alanyl-gamma-D-glutamyl-meso-diaminopimelate ligase
VRVGAREECDALQSRLLTIILTWIRNMHIHILGIGGTFMAGVAQLARAAGHRVTGCDSGVYPPMSTQLEAAEIEVIEGYDAAQTAFEPDCYVVGNAISRGNALLEEVLDRDLPYLSGPQWLAENVLKGRWVLAVAGTHGKTTTSAMLAWILEDAGLSPGFLVGGVPVNFGVSARLSGDSRDSPFFVIEADEYDTAFCDKRSKFVHYRPRTAILNNLEFDHADIFPDLAAIETQFHHLVRTLPRNGLIVSNATEATLERVLARGCWTPVERFNEPRGWRADGSDVEGSLHLLDNDQLAGSTHWALSGAHNRSNAVAALLAARHVGVPLARGLTALSRFRNVKRRLELCGTAGGVTVYDDFAHHPTAIATTLGGLRSKVGRSRILAVLEPRSNTMKLGVMKDLLPDSLVDANLVFCYAGDIGWNVAEALAPLREKVTIEEDLGRLVAQIAGAARPGDQVLVMSNGGFGGIHAKLLTALAANTSAQEMVSQQGSE